jgi:hypothetical protein
MKNQNKTIWFFLIIVFAIVFCVMFFGCEPEDEATPDAAPKTVSIDKHGTVEQKISQAFTDSTTIITTDKYFYNNSGTIFKHVIDIDTLPSLGMTTDTLDTGKTYLDADGDQQEKDTVIVHKKPYQEFISIK